MKKQILLYIFSLITIVLIAQKDEYVEAKNMDKLVEIVCSNINPEFHSEKDILLWKKYLEKPHPNIKTLQLYFESAAAEFKVPLEILQAIAYVESNWTQIGPSIDQGWGIMHLVDNNYAHSLVDAANLLQLDPQILKDDARQNIRGMAALLAKNAIVLKGELLQLEDWFEAVKSITGLYSDELREAQANRYFEKIKTGVNGYSLWDEKIILPSHSIDLSKQLNPDNSLLFPAPSTRSLDYPPAISNLTPCNYADGRNHEVDTWVNHWIGVGTYAGAISWFHNCDAEVSAHFVIRSSDGEITQVVGVANTAWHCGAVGYPFNNSRSIGVEHEATLSNPELWESMPMLEASAQMASYFCDEFEIPKTQSLPGIRGHNDMPGTNTMCPGPLPWFTWMTLLDEDYTESDIVILDMWTEPEFPQLNDSVDLFVTVRNAGNAAANNLVLDFRINNDIIATDSIAIIEANENQSFVYENFEFTESGVNDYCTYVSAASNESNSLNNSYCYDINVLPVNSSFFLETNKNFSIYPNPCHDKLFIKGHTNQIKSIEIINLQGLTIQKLKNPKHHQINISSLPKGIYNVRIQSSQMETHRLIKI